MSQLSTDAAPKLKFEQEPTLWPHQRNGWGYTFGTLLMKNLCAPGKDGVLCVSTVEELVCNEQTIEEDWIGFLHQVPVNNLPPYPDLQRLLKDQFFIKSLERCRGIFVLSSYLKTFLLKNMPEEFSKVPVVRLTYPSSPFPEDKCFNYAKYSSSTDQKPVYFIGEFMRDFQSFHDLVLPQGHKKFLIKPPDVDFDCLFDLSKDKITLKPDDSVTVIHTRVDDDTYDDILASSIVFCKLFDAGANTLVLECIARNTPIVINRLQGVEEYLGTDYPLFYDTLQEASALIGNQDKIFQAFEHLKSMDKTRFEPLRFLGSFVNSSIYRSLPLPPSVACDERYTQFPRFDLTVMICSYKRVYNLERLLQCFVDQDCRKTCKFELIVWNNNEETQDEVKAIIAKFEDKLVIRLIQSSKNYYCTVRLTMPRIMQSETLLICDDDVVPKPNYITKFLTAYKKHGEAVYCFRGHVFLLHSLDHENPEKFWEDYENMNFYDEKADDRQIHFAHACNCLIPKSLLLKIGSIDLPCPEFALVDDYWMSFVFSHKFGVPIWKLKSDDAFESTPCADDENIALFHNKKVKEQRVNFYIYHMNEGWPASVPLDKEINY